MEAEPIKSEAVVSNQPEVEEQHANVVARWSPSEIAANTWWTTSLPCETAEHRLMLLSIIDGDVDSGESQIGREFYLADYVCHPVQLRDQQTGELVDAVRTLVIPTDGLPLAFVAASILDSLGKLLRAVGEAGRFPDPPKVRLVQRGTRGKGRVYSLVPIVG